MYGEENTLNEIRLIRDEYAVSDLKEKNEFTGNIIGREGILV